MPSLAGTLYLVGTPLGNLEDVTARALRVLAEADLIACEDTRRTRKLLARHGIAAKRLLSLHEHNEAERAPGLVAALLEGKTVALVSDAGMPAISDPGYRLVRAAIEAGCTVTTAPGPTAIETALVASGLPTDSFRFGGFLPSKKTQRRKALKALSEEQATLIFYEAPHRILAALEDVRATLGDRPVVVARELTKLHEEYLRGSVSEALAELSARERVKGEITLLIGRGEAPPVTGTPLSERVEELIGSGLGRMSAIKQAARERGLPKREAYRLLEGRG